MIVTKQNAGAALAAAAAVVLLPAAVAIAGGVTGWPEAMDLLSQEGQAAGGSAIPLIIMGLGLIIAMGWHGLTGGALAGLGAAVMIGNSLNISTSLIPGAAAGGGSIFDAALPLAVTAAGLG